MKLSIFSYLLFLTWSAFSQNPVKWTYEAHALEQKGEYELILKAEINKGWAIYSQYLDAKDGPLPTTIDFARDYHYELIGSCEELGKKEVIYDKSTKCSIVKYKRSVIFKQKIKTKDTSKTISGFICYMACNKTQCHPSRDANFVITLPDSSTTDTVTQNKPSFFKRLIH